MIFREPVSRRNWEHISISSARLRWMKACVRSSRQLQEWRLRIWGRKEDWGGCLLGLLLDWSLSCAFKWGTSMHYSHVGSWSSTTRSACTFISRAVLKAIHQINGQMRGKDGRRSKTQILMITLIEGGNEAAPYRTQPKEHWFTIRIWNGVRRRCVTCPFCSRYCTFGKTWSFLLNTKLGVSAIKWWTPLDAQSRIRVRGW